MSEATATPATAVPSAPTAAPVPGPVVVAPAKPKNAIQIIEEEIANFFRQKEQAIANVHAIDGAIQAGQVMLGKLKAEAAKAIAAAEADLAKVEGYVKAEVGKVETEAEKLAGKL
jgi:hypothetical protein